MLLLTKIEKENLIWPLWNAQGAGFIVEVLCADSIRGIKKKVSDSNGQFARRESQLEDSATIIRGLCNDKTRN